MPDANALSLSKGVRPHSERADSANSSPSAFHLRDNLLKPHSECPIGGDEWSVRHPLPWNSAAITCRCFKPLRRSARADQRWLWSAAGRRGGLALVVFALTASVHASFDVRDGIIPPAAERSTGTLTLPRIPAFVPATDARGEISVLTLEQIRAGFAAAGANWPAVRNRHTRFLVLDQAWLTGFLAWHEYFLWKFDVSFQAEVFDCDDFAVSMLAFVDLSMVRSGRHAEAALIGRLTIEQKKNWALTPAGGWHEVILCATQQGLQVIEPQNGRMIALKDYPNRTSIIRLILN